MTPKSMAAPRTIEHNYGKSSPYSIGVEEEFQLVHRETFDLVSRVELIMEKATDADRLQIKPELMQSVVESATKVCANAAEAHADLAGLRARIAELAEQSDCMIASAGTHPFSRYEFQKITSGDRYQGIVSRLRWIAQRELIFGLHVHVGMESPAKAIGIFNAIRTYLPHFLALSANSPFWQGRHTGLQSSRSKVFESFPRSGLPQAFASWEEWEALIQRSVKCGVMDDYTYIWWDVRLHPRFGTIEIRICDGQTELVDTIALAALIQATCAWLGEQFDAGTQTLSHPHLLIAENKWSASRYGLDGTFIDLDTDTVLPTRDAVAALIEKVHPYAQDLGSGEAFAHLPKMLERTGAQRQLDTYEQSESLMSVAEMLVRQTNAV